MNKEKNLEWYKEKVSELVPSISSINNEDFKNAKLAYDIYNDDVRALQEVFREKCKDLGLQVKKYKPQPYPIIHNKINVLKGEMKQRQDEYVINSFSPKINEAKTKQLKENVESKLDEQAERFITNLRDGVPEEELKRLEEEFLASITPEDLDIKNYKTEEELFLNAALRYCINKHDVLGQKIEHLLDMYASSSIFVYSGYKHGKPYLEIRNPLYCRYFKSGNEKYVNKGSYFIYTKARTYEDVLQDYETYLDEQTIETLKNRRYSIHNKKHDVIGGRAKPVFNTFDQEEYYNVSGYRDKTITEFKSNNSYNEHTANNLIWETHVEFRVLEEIYFLSYYDELGVKVTIPVSNDYKIPKGAKKELTDSKFGTETFVYKWLDNETQFELEELKIPVKHECVIINDDVYVYGRRVPNQHINIEDPYESFNLSTFGVIFSDRNSRIISPIQRVLPLYMQYIFVKYIQNKEIAKYKGYIQNIDVDQIPKALGQDAEGNDINDPVQVWMEFLDEGLNFYSGSQTVNNLPPPPTRAPGSSAHVIGVANEIFQMQNLAKLIEAEIGMALGVPHQREAEFKAYSNASDNRQALVQSYLLTEPFMAELDEVWRQAVSDWLKNFTTYCQQELDRGNTVMFDYILPDGSVELFEVRESMLSHENMGLHLRSNASRREYNETMKSLVQAFAQNTDNAVVVISEITKAIVDGAAPAEVHKMIEIKQNEIEKRMQQMQQMQQEAEEKAMMSKKEDDELNHQRELEKIREKGRVDASNLQIKNSQSATL